MKYYLLGKSGLRVSELCLGAMTFGEEWGWGASKDESRKIFNAYVNAGGNLLTLLTNIPNVQGKNILATGREELKDHMNGEV
jgi:hypothetical protein